MTDLTSGALTSRPFYSWTVVTIYPAFTMGSAVSIFRLTAATMAADSICSFYFSFLSSAIFFGSSWASFTSRQPSWRR